MKFSSNVLSIPIFFTVPCLLISVNRNIIVLLSTCVCCYRVWLQFNSPSFVASQLASPDECNNNNSLPIIIEKKKRRRPQHVTILPKPTVPLLAKARWIKTFWCELQFALKEKNEQKQRMNHALEYKAEIWACSETRGVSEMKVHCDTSIDIRRRRRLSQHNLCVTCFEFTFRSVGLISKTRLY